MTAASVTYAYDPGGFLQSKTDGSDVTGYSYSSMGELLSVTLPDNTLIEYVHGPLGRRIAKKVDGVLTEKYLWQGLTRLLAVYDGSDNLLMRFEYADGRMPVSMTKGGVTYYLAYDQVGSLRAVADVSGNVVKQIEYDSFGKIINDSDPTFEVPFGFSGGLYDQDTGLARFGYRDYDPDIGRWTAKDPIHFEGGDTDVYGYCLNDPVNFVDPLGLEVFLVGRGGAMIRPSLARTIPRITRGMPRNIPNESNYQPRYVPTPPQDLMPEPSWLARFLKSLSDLLDSGGAGNSGFGGATTSTTNNSNPCGDSYSQDSEPSMPYDRLWNPGGYL